MNIIMLFSEARPILFVCCDILVTLGVYKTEHVITYHCHVTPVSLSCHSCVIVVRLLCHCYVTPVSLCDSCVIVM